MTVLTTTDISRLILTMPDFDYEGGIGLHNLYTALLTKLGDHVGTRFFYENDLANAGSVHFYHNFKTDFNQLGFELFIRDEVTGALTKVYSSDAGANRLENFSIIPKVGSETTHVTVTNNTGGELDIALLITEGIVLPQERYLTSASPAYTAKNGDKIYVNSGPVGMSITLPASPKAGHVIEFFDIAGAWNSANLTINRNGKNIMGAAADWVLSISNTKATFIYVNDTVQWRVF